MNTQANKPPHTHVHRANTAARYRNVNAAPEVSPVKSTSCNIHLAKVRAHILGLTSGITFSALEMWAMGVYFSFFCSKRHTYHTI